MIPYLAHPVFKGGPFTIQAFGVAVAVALVTGYLLVLRHAANAGLTAVRSGRIYVAVVVSGLFTSYLWNGQKGMSGTGLAIGAMACLMACAAFCPFWPTLDLFAYAVPFTLAIARLGCFFAHDHIGRRTDSWLGVQFSQGVRYDLGLLYSLAAGAVGIAVFLLARTSPRPGILTGVMLVLVATGRLAILPLGSSNPSDYWFAVLMVVVGIWIVWFRTMARLGRVS